MRKHRFAIALAVYGSVLLLVIIAGLVLFWRYIAAYEQSLADTAMERYFAEGRLAKEIGRQIGYFASARETVFESKEDIAAALGSVLENGRLTYGKDRRDSTPDEPVYSVRLDGREIGVVGFWSRPGGRREFGFPIWFVSRAEFVFDGFSQDHTVLAPSGAPVALNGQPLTAADCSVTWEEPPELLPCSQELAEMPLYALYAFSAFSPVEISLSERGSDYLLSREENAFTITEICPPELSEQLYQLSEDFVRAYIAFAGNSSDSADSNTVTGYLVRGGTLYQRIYAALDGLSWVEGETGHISELRMDGLRYYGCAAVLEAHYVLSLDGVDTDNNMEIVLTRTESGWKVAGIELF